MSPFETVGVAHCFLLLRHALAMCPIIQHSNTLHVRNDSQKRVFGFAIITVYWLLPPAFPSLKLSALRAALLYYMTRSCASSLQSQCIAIRGLHGLCQIESIIKCEIQL